MNAEPYTPTEKVIRGICVAPTCVDGAEFDRFIAKVKADALREAAKIIRVSGMPIYEQESGFMGDLNGNDGQSIDTWYASHLEERADRIEEQT